MHHATEEDKQRLYEILSMQSQNSTSLAEIGTILQKYDAIAYVTQKAQAIVTRAWTSIDTQFPPSRSKEILKLFKDYFITQNS